MTALMYACAEDKVNALMIMFRAGQGRAGQGRAGQGRAGQGRAGQGRAGQDNFFLITYKWAKSQVCG